MEDKDQRDAANTRARRAEASATKRFFAAGALAWGAVVAIVACEDTPRSDANISLTSPATQVQLLPVEEVRRIPEDPEEDPGVGGAGDAGMTVIRPSSGPYRQNVDGGAAGMNAQGGVQAVPAQRPGGLQGGSVDAGTTPAPGSKRPTP